MEMSAHHLLKSKGLRKTPQRLQIVDALLRSLRPLSAEDLHRQLGDGGCDLATIYRNLQQLEEQGLIDRTFLSDQVARYVARAAHQTHGHTHHVECRRCGHLTPLQSCLVEKQITQLEKLGFSQISHRLEFTAICATCEK